MTPPRKADSPATDTDASGPAGNDGLSAEIQAADAARQAEADRINTELADQERVDAEQLRGPEAAEPGSAPGPGVVDGPFGTTVDSTDERVGTLNVEVNSNVMLGNVLRTPGQKVAVPDDAESRGAIAVGHLRLLEDDEQLDEDNPEHASYTPF